MIDKQTTEHIAQLARLKLTEAEKEEFTQELNEVLKAFDILATAERAEPAYHPIELKDQMRQDLEQKACGYETLLTSSRQKEGTQIKGPRIL